MNKGKSYTLLIQTIPCINCITLPICRGKVLNQLDEERKRETTKWLCNFCEPLFKYVTNAKFAIVDKKLKTHIAFSYSKLNNAVAFFRHPHDGKELI